MARIEEIKYKTEYFPSNQHFTVRKSNAKQSKLIKKSKRAKKHNQKVESNFLCPFSLFNATLQTKIPTYFKLAWCRHVANQQAIRMLTKARQLILPR